MKGLNMLMYMAKEQKRTFIKRIIEDANSHLVSVSFVKKDGTDRTMNIQYAAMFSRLKGEEGDESGRKAAEKAKESHPEHMPVYCVDSKGIRKINLDTVYKIVSKGKTYEFD